MKRRASEIVGEVLRRRSEAAAEEVSRRLREAEGRALVSSKRKKEVSNFARNRRCALEDEPIDLGLRDAFAARSQEELMKLSRARDEAVEELREARERMKKSSSELARAIAVERAARRSGISAHIG